MFFPGGEALLCQIPASAPNPDCSQLEEKQTRRCCSVSEGGGHHRNSQNDGGRFLFPGEGRVSFAVVGSPQKYRRGRSGPAPLGDSRFTPAAPGILRKEVSTMTVGVQHTNAA